MSRFGRGVGRTVAIAIVLALLAPGAATSRGEKRSRLDTFTGSCEFKATVRFTPPLSGEQQQTHADALGVGKCSGTWDSRRGSWRLDGDEVLYKAHSDGTQSCASAEVPGEGLLKYRGRTLRFRLFEQRVGAQAELELTGVRGGRLSATAAPEGDPVAAVRSCAGEGLAESKAVISGETDPSISG